MTPSAPHIIPESRWPLAATVAVAAMLAFIRPSWLAIIPPWVLPLGWSVLLIALLMSAPADSAKRSTRLRIFSGVLATLVALSALESAVALTLDIVSGNGHTNAAGPLLAASAIVWALNIVAFSLLYWQFDGGGSWARAHKPPLYPDLAFPQVISPDLAPPQWRPQFLDYLYLGFTNMTAFSPTDVMPLAIWAKLLMSVQALVSLIILMLVVSRAINILN